MTYHQTEKSRRTPSARPEASRRRPHIVPYPTPSPETHVVQLSSPWFGRPFPTRQYTNSYVFLLSFPGYFRKSPNRPPPAEPLELRAAPPPAAGIGCPADCRFGRTPARKR